jgi:hypothetical protein
MMSHSQHPVTDFLSRPCPREIQHEILSYIAITQLVLLGATSHSHFLIVKWHIRRRVADLLSRWSLPQGFTRLMLLQKLIISGSAILALLQPDCFIPNDLDAYVSFGHLKFIEEYLNTHTPYVKFSKVGTFLMNMDQTDTYVADGTGDTGR